ncbi:DUF4226 domain-containing protein [Mycobacterium sp. M1]|uniref:DUF4226 domain-containing protein n=1 Tax=Mycolicibacter acidiphilus TaxID=2835306 RepID=A0ABS5RN15_9MYCO|nr:DUF4226 domain-containing protein [Mycolicibacter acidiphilus]MBS9535601.1 DUF4226 domain-containing protein [Mycolicibacter acidiphilus]
MAAVEPFLRAAGAMMGVARDALGSDATTSVGSDHPTPADAPTIAAPSAPEASGAGPEALQQRSAALSQSVAELARISADRARQHDDANSAAAAHRQRMDAVIAATHADVERLTPQLDTPHGNRELVTAIETRLDETRETLADAQADAHARVTAAQELAARYDAIGGDAEPHRGPAAKTTGWHPGDKHTRPFIAGDDGIGPPNIEHEPPWVRLGPDSRYFVPADEIPGYQTLPPGERPPGDDTGTGYVELGPGSGVWVPFAAFPDAVIQPPGQLGPYGTTEYVPGSGLWIPDSRYRPTWRPYQT